MYVCPCIQILIKVYFENPPLLRTWICLDYFRNIKGLLRYSIYVVHVLKNITEVYCLVNLFVELLL